MRPPPEIDDLAAQMREDWDYRVPGVEEPVVCRHAVVAAMRRARRKGLPSRDVRLENDQRRAPDSRYTGHVIVEVYAGGRWWAIECWREGDRYVSGARPYPVTGQDQPRRDPRWYEHIGKGRAFSKLREEADDERESAWLIEYHRRQIRERMTRMRATDEARARRFRR